jgi:hypothetical protein
MGQDAHRKFKEFKNAQFKLKSYSSESEKRNVKIKELEWKLQESFNTYTLKARTLTHFDI